ncbi:MAG TPA: histidine kinase [Kineosporiaceae bacterium]|nr:histidine kinase [Kineosporiaceae bacterium]
MSQAARFDLSMRAPMYAVILLVPLVVGTILGPRSERSALFVTCFAAVHAVISLLLVHAGLDHYLGRGPRPTGLLTASVTLALSGSAAGLLAFPDRSTASGGPATFLLTVLVALLIMGMSVTVRPRTTMAVIVLGCAATYALTRAQGAPAAAPGTAAVFLLIAVATLISYRVTAWMLDLVWRLDRSTQIQANLAVAEERLRFARDLHDVLGRSLSAIAVKAELAAQLGRRGREEAFDEILHVRRIAQDSLTELRAVVGGYRTADLGVELAGARSLLASAGIDCSIVGDGSCLPTHVQSTLGWAVREGTTNVLRHSDARTCTITLDTSAGDRVTLVVENDSLGGTFDSDEPGPRSGTGLVGLAERVGALGGTVTAGALGDGLFRITVEVPLPLTAPAAAGVSADGEAER